MLYSEALAVDRHTATVGSRRDLRNRLVAGAVVAIAGVFVVYLLAVRTRWEQDYENAALVGAQQHVSGSWYADADRWLNRLTAESFGVSLAVIAIVGLLRRRLLLALCGVLTAGGAVAAARFLKGVLPSRPVFGTGAASGGGHPVHAVAANAAAATLHTLSAGVTASPLVRQRRPRTRSPPPTPPWPPARPRTPSRPATPPRRWGCSSARSSSSAAAGTSW